jgi:hypothetical protein
VPSSTLPVLGDGGITIGEGEPWGEGVGDGATGDGAAGDATLGEPPDEVVQEATRRSVNPALSAERRRRDIGTSDGGDVAGERCL